MAFGNFWRGGGRERFGSERDQDRNRERERWRTTGSDWRDDERDRCGGDTAKARQWHAQSYGSGGQGYGGERYRSQRQRGLRLESGAAGAASERESDYSGSDAAAANTTIGAAVCTAVVPNSGVRIAGGSSYGLRRHEQLSAEHESRSYGSESPWGSQGRSSGQGIHRGRGPRNYKRADERIREDVCDCLTEDAYIDASSHRRRGHRRRSRADRHRLPA